MLDNFENIRMLIHSNSMVANVCDMLNYYTEIACFYLYNSMKYISV